MNLFDGMGRKRRETRQEANSGLDLEKQQQQSQGQDPEWWGDERPFLESLVVAPSRDATMTSQDFKEQLQWQFQFLQSVKVTT